MGTLQPKAAKEFRVQVRCGGGVEFWLIGKADHLVFRTRRHVVRQQLDLLQIIRVQKAAGRSAEILLRIVDAGDDRNADAERPAAFLEPFEVSRIGSLDTPV